MGTKFNWTEHSKLAYEEFLRGNYEQCKRAFLKAQKILRKTNKHDDRIGYASMMIGSCFYRQRNFKAAFPYFRNAYTIYRKHNDKLTVENSYWLAYCFYNLKRWKQAIKTFNQTIKLYQLFKCDDRKQLFYSLAGAGIAAWDSGQYIQSTNYFKKAIDAGDDLSLPLFSYYFLSGELISISQSKPSKTKPPKILIDLVIRSTQLLKLKQAKTHHPDTKRIPHRDKYFDKVISDPYRWLENSSSDNAKEWLKLQNSYSSEYLDNLPASKYVYQRISALWNKNDTYLPYKRGGYYFSEHKKNNGLQLCRSKTFNGKVKVILDGSELPVNSEITNTWTSKDGHSIVYSVSENGSEWQTLHIYDVKTRKHFAETIKNICWIDVLWKSDNSGFYYVTTTLENSKRIQTIFFHKLRTLQNKDRVIYHSKNSPVTFGVYLTKDNKYLVLCGRKNRQMTHFVHLIPLRTKNSNIIKLLDNQKTPVSFVANKTEHFYFLTYTNAPLGQLIKIEINDKSPKRFILKTVIPEQNSLLRNVHFFSDFLVAHYASIKGGVLRRFTYDNKKLGETHLPKFTQIHGGSSVNNDKIFSVEGYLFPRQIFRYLPRKDSLLPLRKDLVPFNRSKYTTEIQWVQAKDNVRIPVYLSYKKGMLRNGNNPTILTAYGGFGSYRNPGYSAYNITWMESGGIIAHAILRGDLNLGWDWRIACLREKKQNTFDDIISVAQFLIKEGYTCPVRLGIEGVSNGGLTMAYALVHRPDLFGAAVIESALLDMLRFSKFGLAKAYIYEYGCSDNKADFRILHKYSPLHRLKAAVYPPTLILAGDSDDRVSPIHSYKFAAALQHYQKGNAPIMLKVVQNKGHSQYKSDAYSFNFLVDSLGLITKQLKT